MMLRVLLPTFRLFQHLPWNPITPRFFSQCRRHAPNRLLKKAGDLSGANPGYLTVTSSAPAQGARSGCRYVRSCRRQQFRQSDQVVGSGGKGEGPSDFLDPPVFGLAHAGDGLHPAKAFLDPSLRIRS